MPLTKGLKTGCTKHRTTKGRGRFPPFTKLKPGAAEPPHEAKARVPTVPFHRHPCNLGQPFPALSLSSRFLSSAIFPQQAITPVFPNFKARLQTVIFVLDGVAPQILPIAARSTLRAKPPFHRKARSVRHPAPPVPVATISRSGRTDRCSHSSKFSTI